MGSRSQTNLMTQISLCMALVLILLSTCFHSSASQETPRRAAVTGRSPVGTIKDQSRLDGCGCYFNFASDRRERCVLYADLADGPALMNIDGRDVRLSLAKRLAPASERVGSRSTEIYQAPGIKVTARYVTIAMCAPSDENCESISYDATFTVIKGKRQQTVKLEGVCGC